MFALGLLPRAPGEGAEILAADHPNFGYDATA
jgi:hypothetical protein